MKLFAARIQNYRSIVDTGDVEIDERVTVLVGKNEQGKTTFLKGLSTFNSEAKYSPSDFPRHMLVELEQKPPETIPVVTVFLKPEPNEITRLQNYVPDAEQIDAIIATKFFDGHRVFLADRKGAHANLEFNPPSFKQQVDQFSASARALKDKLAAHAARYAEFQPRLPQAQGHLDQFLSAKFETIEQIDNQVQTLAAALASLPNQDTAIQQDIARTVKDIEVARTAAQQIAQTDAAAAFDALLPRFILHSTTLDMVPNEVPVNEFIADPDKVSRGMANLCRVAGLSMQKIKELAATRDTSTRESNEDFFKGKVSGGINEYWTQETYNVHFRFEHDRLSVSISDETYQHRIPPRDRSDGFQWYLSFYAALLNEVSQLRPTIFLLDNPALELHADGQRDIKQFLQEKLQANVQVIYVTHSPAMIDPFQLDQVRGVTLHAHNKGTRIARLEPSENDFDLLEPVRTAIGASLATSLILGHLNLLVEGAADKPILEGALVAFEKPHAAKIVVNGSIAESPNGFLARFYQRSGLPFIVFVDADDGGREIAKKLKGWDIPDDKIMSLQSVIERPGGNDFELEDVVSTPDYHAAVRATYPDIETDPPTGEYKGKKTKFYKDALKAAEGIGFNKRRVGESLKKLIEEGKIDGETQTSLSNIAKALVQALNKQAEGKK